MLQYPLFEMVFEALAVVCNGSGKYETEINIANIYLGETTKVSDIKGTTAQSKPKRDVANDMS